MAKPAALIDLRDIPAALGLLTRLPVRVDPDFATKRGAAAAWAYPLVGLCTGLPAWALAVLALWIGVPPLVAAGLAVMVPVILTGALHEDGFADTADGLWGGWTPVRRLELMKDSHIGTYGVLALILAIGLRWQILAPIIEGGFLLAAILSSAALSRAAMVAVMAALPHARPDGLSASVGRPTLATALIASGLALAIAGSAAGWATLPLAVVVGGTAAGIAALAKSRIGGQTGDILGAVQVVTEIVGLLTLLALAGTSWTA